MKNKFSVLLFDWDGCLVNTLPVWLAAYKKIYQKYGVNPTTEEIVAKSWGNWEKGPENFGLKNSKEVIAEVLNELNKNYAFAPFHVGVKETLDKLNNGQRKMALISSSTRKQIQNALHFLNAEKYFSFQVVKEDVKKYKPDPEGILKIIDFFKAKKEDCLMIGDAKTDVAAGKSAGIKTLLFYPAANWLFYRKEDVSNFGANYLIEDFRKIIEIVG